GEICIGGCGTCDTGICTGSDQPTPHADVESKGNPKNNGGKKRVKRRQRVIQKEPWGTFLGSQRGGEKERDR
ncbi:hypothetical protein TNCV_3380021, partial [Trichonephila clavipes]